MSDATLTALLIAIPLIITSISQLIVSIRNGAKTDVVLAKQDATTLKQEATAEKVIEIHTQTNGNLSAMREALATSQKEMLGLKALIAEMVQNKKDLQVKDLQVKEELK